MKLEKDKRWKWPAEKMREWTDAELKTREREFSDQLFRLKFQIGGRPNGTRHRRPGTAEGYRESKNTEA